MTIVIIQHKELFEDVLYFQTKKGLLKYANWYFREELQELFEEGSRKTPYFKDYKEGYSCLMNFYQDITKGYHPRALAR